MLLASAVNGAGGAFRLPPGALERAPGPRYSYRSGRLAQLGERRVDNAEVAGSSPASSIRQPPHHLERAALANGLPFELELTPDLGWCRFQGFQRLDGPVA